MIFGLLILLAVLLTIGAAALSFRRKRLPGRIQPWGVRYNPDCIYSAQTINQVITAFVDVWTKHYPADRPALVASLKNLDIEWHASRVSYTDKEGKTSEVYGLMENPSHIHLWIGPKLKGGSRNIIYTGLLDQLSKVALISNNKEIRVDDPEVRKVLANVRDQIPRT
jgi:hypothetical protein